MSPLTPESLPEHAAEPPAEAFVSAEQMDMTLPDRGLEAALSDPARTFLSLQRLSLRTTSSPGTPEEIQRRALAVRTCFAEFPADPDAGVLVRIMTDADAADGALVSRDEAQALLDDADPRVQSIAGLFYQSVPEQPVQL